MSQRHQKGVRDLNTLPAKPAGVKLQEPPVPVNCKHRWQEYHEMGISMLRCIDCSEEHDPWHP